MLGYNIVSYSSTEDHPDANNYGSGLDFSFFVGCRWFFTDNIGEFAEIGYGSSVLKAELAFKFNRVFCILFFILNKHNRKFYCITFCLEPHLYITSKNHIFAT